MLTRMLQLQSTTGPLLDVQLGAEGRPVRATALARVDCSVQRLWSVISDVERYAERVPMIHRVRRQGDTVKVELRFKLALFSVGFDFTAKLRVESERWLELTWLAGEPRGIRLRFELEPTSEGSVIRSHAEFDAQSLGWLAKYFLRHHPEIEYGIFPGVALALVDSMRRAALT